MIETGALWTVIILLGLGSFGLRFVFTGLVGDRAMPDWLLRHLRYTAVAILPALVAPQVVWPSVTDGVFDIPRAAAAVVTLAVGLGTKNVLLAMTSGAGTLYGLLYLLG
ncbi:branched-subunit amino acid transport protein [Sulfitobacter undariae]|uniref:Branched-subunit amino acid transport protein n=1 Tax=Sulfitobacter undariae TaxID=1563671 RepID=A0A7W6E5V4_9RHOB|nr:AzlD domain-containing protein [Sulfitobacter undariae]MBB3993207.1 branched-subunit amino acid transport protein [Sulfitobacter undariae]